MDHLPVVPAGTIQGLETVPLVCEKSYDGGPFLTYPIREGKPQIVPDIANGPGQMPFWEYEKHYPTPNKDFEAFCQTWLFIGLINELLGDLCTSQDFVRGDKVGDSKIISTSQLRGLVDQWVKRVEEGSSTITYEHVAKCLNVTHSTLRAAGSDFDLRVKVCIASVGELFAHATNKAFGIEDLVLHNQCPGTWHLLFDENLWIEPLKKSNWCPSQIEIMMRSKMSLQSLYFFTSMQDPISAGRHGLCDNQKCLAYQTNPKNYAPQHVIKACRCKDLYIDMSSLNAAVKIGALPLLRIREAGTLDDLTVEIVVSQPDTCYVALSHVWADGLGNPKANALPRCQLLHLSKLTQNLRAKLSPENPPNEVLLWCDTLCCPIAPTEAKNQVLTQMKSIYEQATGVLVLEASIRLYDSEAMGPEETCARILTSAWMRRLWTLQEGALPANKGRLWFQFRHQAVNLRPLWQQMIRLFNNDLGRKGLAHTILHRMRTITTFFHHDPNTPEADLATVDAALQHRSVSVSSDEPLLIGTLLDLDVAGILRGSEETRIHRMWSLMPTAVRGLSKDILFRLGPRLREKGYRWAPSSMLYHEDSNSILQTMRKGDNQGIPTQHGLMVRLSGHHVSFANRPAGLPANPWGIVSKEDVLYMRGDESCWYLVSRRRPSVEGDCLSEEKFCGVMRSHTNLWVTHLETDFQARKDGDEQTSTALLTRLVQECEEVKYVQSYMHIHAALMRQTSREMFEAAYRCAQKLAESAPAQQLANMSKNGTNMESPEYKAVFDALKPEIFRIAASGNNEIAMTTARQSSGKDHDVLFGAIIGMLFIGDYAIIGPRTPDNQQWCVD
ncbi:hypothetical protein IMSHALPRED_001243 [Imshaugia aleurites]|uniref:Heterokaryon incompatibility domain-containing protein n=1 Tax=Imshaugia aleurites TaxID=172621 RepID=A0A8H3J1X0_9LECA|nr:hypothetical protein IMSHALPRED_001243 [Imshaugia aleurites]